MVCFAGSHGDAFELFEFTEEVLDQMPPFVYLGVNSELLGAARVLRDDDLRPARVEILDDPVRVEGLITEQCPELDPNPP